MRRHVILFLTMFLFLVLLPLSTRRQNEPACGEGGSRPSGISCYSHTSQRRAGRCSCRARRPLRSCQARADPTAGLGSRSGRGDRRSAEEPGASPGAPASRPQQGPQPPRREVQRGLLLMSPSTGPLHSSPSSSLLSFNCSLIPTADCHHVHLKWGFPILFLSVRHVARAFSHFVLNEICSHTITNLESIQRFAITLNGTYFHRFVFSRSNMLLHVSV